MSKSNDWTLGGVGVGGDVTGSAGSFKKSLGLGKVSLGPLRLNTRVAGLLIIMLLVGLVILLIPGSKQRAGASYLVAGQSVAAAGGRPQTAYYSPRLPYNRTYPLTAPERTLDGQRFRIGLISDLDTASKFAGKDNTWVAFLLRGHLSVNGNGDQVSVTLDKEPVSLHSQLARGGRGMELSELITFDGRLLTVDDRTGVVYEINQNTVIPWTILADGDGKNTKGFKAEWMAVRDQILYVGGLGKEWTTTSGELVNLNPQWVKAVDPQGGVQHLKWVNFYNAMRKEAGFSYPGYMIHEAGVWSEVHQRWFFMPRRASAERYTEEADEHRATNLLISCSADFADIRVRQLGPLNRIRGFSSFKFVPGTGDTVAVALKTEEDRGSIATYYTAFNIDGRILVPETKFADVKYEGIEFI